MTKWGLSSAILGSLQICLIRFKSGLWLGRSDVVLAVSFGLLSVVEDEPLAQSEFLSVVEQIFIEDLSVLCAIQLSFNPEASVLLKNTPTASCSRHHCFTVEMVLSRAWFPPVITFRVLPKQFNLGFIMFLTVWVSFRYFLANYKQAFVHFALRLGFHLATLP